MTPGLMEVRAMTKFLLPIAIAIGLYNTPSFAGQEKWLVKEGVEGELHGVWIVNLSDDKLSGSAQMFNANGEPLTYDVSGKRVEDEFVLERESPSNGVNCKYWLKQTPQDTDGPLPISSPSDCDGKNQLWLVSKLPDY